MYVRVKSYLIMIGEQPFYRWRMADGVSGSQRDLRKNKYEKISQQYWRYNRKLLSGEHSIIIGGVMETFMDIGSL